MAFVFTGGDETSLTDLKESHVVTTSGLKMSLSASEAKVVDAGRCIQVSEHNKNTLDDLETMVNEVEARLKTSEEHVHFFGDVESEQSNQLIEKDFFSSGFRERVVVLEKSLADAYAVVEHCHTQNFADERLLGGSYTALAVHETVLQQRDQEYTKHREKLLAGKGIIENEFCKFREVM